MMPDKKTAVPLRQPDREAPEAYASPACYAHEVDPDYMMAPDPPPLAGAELVGLLNELLEAERAGARILAWYAQDAEADLQPLLADLRHDEARYVAILRRLVTGLGGVPSPETGSFYERARAVAGTAARLRFLNRGQAWVARRLEAALPRIADAEIRQVLQEMALRHQVNVARATAYLGD